jgi:ribosomal protein S27E
MEKRKLKLTTLNCPNCGATYNPAHLRCEYCGAVIIMSKENQYNIPEQIIERVEDEGANCPGVFVFGTLLGKGETPLRLGAANYYKNAFINVGGKLLLTKKSLQFSTHTFMQDKSTVVIPLEDILMAEYDKSNLGISDQISVHTNDKRHKFVVYGGNIWVNMINNAKQELTNPKHKAIKDGGVVSADYTEELKRLKSLLDAGIITEEEFSIKKRQLLNI